MYSNSDHLSVREGEPVRRLPAYAVSPAVSPSGVIARPGGTASVRGDPPGPDRAIPVSVPVSATASTAQPVTRKTGVTPNPAAAAVAAAAPSGPSAEWMVQNAEVTRPSSRLG